jgi:predicted Rossmann fold nucleotide-binding protein DprA/Smf involved in DNA uptake
MNLEVSENTRATLLLTGTLILGKKSKPEFKPLTPTQYTKLATRLRELEKSPADLLGKEVDSLLQDLGSHFTAELPRLNYLLGRGLMMSEALDQWASRGISIVGRSDAHYPAMLRYQLKASSPPIIYGAGNWSLAENGGLAVVGSRSLPDALLQLTKQTGSLAAQAGIQIVSGGAKGVDQAAMLASLDAGGNSIGFLADKLWASVVAKHYRTALRENRLLLLSAVDPNAGFHVGTAMQRNKFIYALANTSLIINSDFQSGGTWSGALEQINRFRFTHIHTVDHPECSSGNQALRDLNASTWPNPQTADELKLAFEKDPPVVQPPSQPSDDLRLFAPTVKPAPEITSTTPSPDITETVSEPNDELATVESSPADTTAPNPTDQANENLPKSTQSPAAQLRVLAQQLILELAESPIEVKQLITSLEVDKKQLDAWTKPMISDGLIVITKKRPMTYQTNPESIATQQSFL